MVRHYFEWTEEVLSLVRRLADERKSAAEIAAALDNAVTRNSVIGKCYRENIPLTRTGREPKQLTPEELERKKEHLRKLRRESWHRRRDKISIQRAARRAARQAELELKRQEREEREAELREALSVPARKVEIDDVYTTEGISIVDLANEYCHMPIGRDSDDRHHLRRYCGRPVPMRRRDLGPHYCESCFRLVYRPVETRMMRRAAERNAFRQTKVLEAA